MDTTSNIVSRWMTLCSRREYCSYDILSRLKRDGISDSDAAKVLSRLQKESFQSDLRYATAYVREKSHLAGWGKNKIVNALKLKRIDNSVIIQALGEVDAGAVEKRMKEVIERKWNSLSKEPEVKRREKVLRFALGRGYGFEEVLKVINSLK